MDLTEIVTDAAVLEWVARQFPELDQDTASVGEAIHASQSSLSRKGVVARSGLKPTSTEAAKMEIYVQRGEYSIHSRRPATPCGPPLGRPVLAACLPAGPRDMAVAKQMFAPPGHRDFVPGRTTLVDHTDGHDAATVIVKKPAEGSHHNAANWRIHSRKKEHPGRNRRFFQYLHDSPLPNQTGRYVEDGGQRAFTVKAEGNKGWWVQHWQTQNQNNGGIKIPADIRFKIADPGRAA